MSRFERGKFRKEMLKVVNASDTPQTEGQIQHGMFENRQLVAGIELKSQRVPEFFGTCIGDRGRMLIQHHKLVKVIEKHYGYENQNQ